MPDPTLASISLVVRVARLLRTNLDQRFEPFGLTSQQAGLLVHVLSGVGGPSRLADLLGTDTAGMTRLLDRLEGKGLVSRSADPRDRRAVVVELTASARDLAPRLPAVFMGLAEELAARIADRDIAVTERVLTAMLETLAGAIDADEDRVDGIR